MNKDVRIKFNLPVEKVDAFFELLHDMVSNGDVSEWEDISHEVMWDE